MSRTQAIVDKVVSLMRADSNFTAIKRYVTSGKDVDINQYPVCVVVVDADDITRIGHKNQHRLSLSISFSFLDHDFNGERHSYKMADNLEALLEANMKIQIPTGEFVGFQLLNKLYELDIETTQIVDGVMCEVECKYIV